MPVNKKKLLWVSVFVILFIGGIVGGFLYFSKRTVPPEKTAPPSHADLRPQDLSSVRVYYPSEGRLVTEDRRIERQSSPMAVAEVVVGEYLKGPSSVKSEIPKDARLLRVYSGNDGILYLDISDEFRRNFQGDALAEYLLLKGLYESIISNVSGIQDVKVIIEGKEIESIGGHFFAMYPLKNMLGEVK